MRVCLAVSLPLLLTLVLAAAPVPTPAPVPPPAASSGTHRTPNDSDTFAFLLLEAVNRIADLYVRPVSRADLVETALTALYEAARRPAPHDLRRRIDRAEKEVERSSQAMNAQPPPMGPALGARRLKVRDDRVLLEMLRAVRTDLGRSGQSTLDQPLRVCCQAMLRSLDPYSGVISPNEERRSIGPNPEREGFGLTVLEADDDRAVLHDVLPGSPAQQAGLRADDVIVRLEDSDGRTRKIKDLLNVLNGRAPLLKPELGALALPEPIALTYRRPGVSGERRVVLRWRRFRPESVFGVTRNDNNSWNYWVDEKQKIAHLRLGNLVEGTPEELSDVLEGLRRDGLRGLILDLRWCPGGALLGSVRTAELFLGEGTIATVEYRNQPPDTFRSTREGKHNDFPMVVLINEDSTGGAEMIAAALQDHHRAVLVGQRTHGKGNVQKLFGIGGVGVKVTSGTIRRPSGKELHRFPDSKPDDDWGVRPDPGHEFRVSAEVSRALRTWWEQQTMRPGSSMERLPLDDPLADPQRNAALETLSEQLSRKARASSK
jgi:carboxyl-terminal processing protease